jgi:hypothetical protein
MFSNVLGLLLEAVLRFVIVWCPIAPPLHGGAAGILGTALFKNLATANQK